MIAGARRQPNDSELGVIPQILSRFGASPSRGPGRKPASRGLGLPNQNSLAVESTPGLIGTPSRRFGTRAPLALLP